MKSITMTTTTTMRSPVIRSLAQPAENSWRTRRLRHSPNLVMTCLLCTTVTENSNISGAVNTIAVLDMINSLQEEIKDSHAAAADEVDNDDDQNGNNPNDEEETSVALHLADNSKDKSEFHVILNNIQVGFAKAVAGRDEV